MMAESLTGKELEQMAGGRDKGAEHGSMSYNVLSIKGVFPPNVSDSLDVFPRKGSVYLSTKLCS